MRTVLVADDDPDILGMLVLRLEQAGHRVLAVPDGPTALAEVRRVAPDLAVLDVAMPGLSGLDVCRVLHEDPATAAIPVVLLTARAEDGDVEAGWAAGAADYIVKPPSLADLVTRIDALLARSPR